MVGILALINIGLLIFLFVGRPQAHGPEGFKGKDRADQFIQKKFGFDQDQMKSFSKSKVIHRNVNQDLQTKLDQISQSFYLNESPDEDPIRDSILSEINLVSNEIYRNNANHFDEVKSICKPEQLPELKKFIRSLLPQNRKDGPKRNKKRRLD